MSWASDCGRLLATAVACIGIALGVAAPAAAQTPTPEQLEIFNKLPLEQQRALMEQATRGGAVQADAPLAVPETSRPKTSSLHEPASDAEKAAPDTGEPKASGSDSSGLKPFGYDLFRSAPTTFAPATDIPVPADYVIGPGDTFEVLLVGERGGRYRLVVGRDGVVNFPELGPIAVARLRFEAARDLLEQRVAEQMIGMRASISMGALRSIQVFVLGEAESPGSYTVSGLSTITNALLVSGGAKTIGSLRNIQLKRAGQIVGRIDLYDMLLDGDTSADQRLQPGDVIFIPPVGTTVAVTGAVRRPAIYEVKEGALAAEMLYLSGGLTPQADPRTAKLERVDDRRNRTVVDIDLTTSAGRNTRLQTGDTVHIQPIRDSQEGAVTLVGHVYREGPTQFKTGMRITDLFGSLDELRPLADPHYVLIRRESGPTRVVSVASADLVAAFSSPTSEANLPLEARDRVVVFNREGGREQLIELILVDLQRQGTPDAPVQIVSVYGAVKAPGRYPLEPGMTVADVVRAGGGLGDASYQARAELTRMNVDGGDTRTTEVITIDLAAALRGDTTSNVRLKPYDYLNIKQVPEWGEQAVVQVQGEVRFPGSYPIKRGETLKSVIERAGGLTSLAFSEGSVFLRESLREREREQLKVLANRLQADLATLALQSSQVGDTSNGVQALAVGQQLLSQLQTTEPVGRLVIDLQRVLATEEGGSSDVVLRAGDRLMIPKRSQEVTVLGEVQNAMSHFYRDGLGRNEYIALSGGFTSRADKGRVYVVRADGSVAVGRSGSWFRRGDLKVMPGDTVVAPLEADRVRPLTLWTAVTQILYNIAVSVAAVNSF